MGSGKGCALLALATVTLGFLLAHDPSPGASQDLSRTVAATLVEQGGALEPAPRGAPMARLLSADTADASCALPVDQMSLAESAFSYESPALAAPHAFNALAFRWEGDVPEPVRVRIETRASAEGVLWSAWTAAEELDALRGERPRDTDLVFLAGRFLQYRVAMEDVPLDWEPRLAAVRVTVIDSTAGPTAGEAAGQGSLLTRLAGLVRPSVIPRKSWGAEELLRYSQGSEVWPRRYVAPRKIIVHHSASTNNPVDAAAVVRAIYFYHAVQQGWGDIGYNYVIDAEGRIYEGRIGGPGVVGAHAEKYNPGSIGIAFIGTFTDGEPTPKALATLDQFVLAKAVEHGIDPRGRSLFVDKETPNVMGHRDVMGTACPGERLYALLPGVRDRAFADLPPYGQGWGSHNVPKLMDPGATLSFTLEVRNTGTAAWTTGGANPVRLGYRWYSLDGKPLEENTALELHSSLPRAVDPGQAVSIAATVRTPKQPGSYLLRWDMVQERVTWFEDQGNTPLTVTVAVLPFGHLSVAELAALPNDLVRLLPQEKLLQLPLSRLQLLSNDEIVELIPDLIPQFANERMLSFANDYLLRYLPDGRLKTFSLDRIRTFPLYVQQRLGYAPTPTATATPPASSPTPGGTPALLPTATPTPPAQPTAGAVQPRLPTASPTPTPIVYPTDDQTGGAVAR